MNQFVAGMKDYWRALALVRRHRMWPWLILPGLISFAYFPGVSVGTYFFVADAETYVRDHLLPGFLKQRMFSIIITAALWLAALYIGFMLFRNVILIVYAPVLGYMSARMEEKLKAGSLQTVPPVKFLKATMRVIGMSLLSLGLSLASLVLSVGLLIIPLLGGVLMTVFLTVTQMFLAGHGFLDPTFERHGYGVGRSISAARKYRWRTMGCGSGFLLLTAIPVVGWFLGPTVGVLAGTISALDIENGEGG
ncbi:MAG TPA: EI24 domain-containing protein [Verrucomicrobiae bacterium]|nr:EI24 domain-containing protein [Verrucomicrobiae bacterium]